MTSHLRNSLLGCSRTAEHAAVTFLLLCSCILAVHGNDPTRWHRLRDSDWLNRVARWDARGAHVCVALRSGGALLIGGGRDFDADAWRSDVWRTDDAGASWELVADKPGWAARKNHMGLTFPNGSVIIMGGGSKGSDRISDVWQSDDEGQTWRELTSRAEWGRRANAGVVAVDARTVLLVGGTPNSDVWQSGDGGRSWTLVTAVVPWRARQDHAVVLLPNGRQLLLFGGRPSASPVNDVWVSEGGEAALGAQWRRVAEHAPWPARYGLAATITVQGDVLLAGGTGTDGLLNDVWRCTPASQMEESVCETWERVSEHAPWVPRFRHTLTTLASGGVLVTGGWDGMHAGMQDSWLSPDAGTRWVSYFTDAPFTPRFGHAVVVMEGGILLLTGGRDARVRNDVWRSTNLGATWALTASNASWAPRRSHCAVVLSDGAVLLFGGTGGSEQVGEELADVWQSSNRGALWLPVLEQAPWPARYAAASVRLRSSEVLLLGGGQVRSIYETHCFGDVWSTQDNGVTWTQVVTQAAWKARTGHACVALPDDELVLMGGLDCEGIPANDVWRSRDAGASWYLATRNAPWRARSQFGSVALPSGALVLHGGMQPDRAYADTWRSLDKGESWDMVALCPECGARAGHALVAVNPSPALEDSPALSVVVIGGQNGPLTLNDVWLGDMRGGEAWLPVSAIAPWAALRVRSATTVLGNGTLLLLGGVRANDAWKSVDEGATWRQYLWPTPWGPQDGPMATVLGDGKTVLFMGGLTSAAVWRSDDGGDSWALVLAAAPWGMRTAAVVLPIGGDAVVLIGGSELGQSESGEVWRTDDKGLSWHLVTPRAAWRTRKEHAVVQWQGNHSDASSTLTNSSMVLLGGTACPLCNDVWSSEDEGSTWQLIIAKAPWKPRCKHSAVVLRGVGGSGAQLLLFGGEVDMWAPINDVWRSADGGRTWVEVLSRAPWAPMVGFATFTLAHGGSVVLISNAREATVWRTDDLGATWYTVIPSERPTARGSLPDGASFVAMGTGAGGWRRMYRTNDRGHTWEARTDAQVRWSSLGSTPVQGSARTALATADRDELLQLRFPVHAAGAWCLPLLNHWSADRAWRQLSVSALPAGLVDSATTTMQRSRQVAGPEGRAALRPGMLVCGGRFNGGSAISACWWVGCDTATVSPESSDLTLCGATTAGPSPEAARIDACPWSARHGAVLAATPYIVSGGRGTGLSDVAALFGGVDDSGAILADLWLSTSGGTTWTLVSPSLSSVLGFGRVSLGFVEAPPLAPACGPEGERLRLVLIGGVSKSMEVRTSYTVLDACIGTARVHVGSVEERVLALSGSVRPAFEVATVQLPDRLLCVVGGRTSQASLLARAHVSCTCDGEAWLNATSDATSVVAGQLQQGFGVAFLPATHDLVVLAGPGAVFASLRFDVLVQPVLEASFVEEGLLVQWAGARLTPPPVDAVTLQCAFTGRTIATTNLSLAAPPQHVARVSLPRATLACPGAMYRACVALAESRGVVCGAATRASVALDVASTQVPIANGSFAVTIASRLPGACFRFVGTVLPTNTQHEPAPPSVRVFAVAACFNASGAATLGGLFPNTLDLRGAANRYSLRVLAYAPDGDMPLVSLVSLPLAAVLCPSGMLLSRTRGECDLCPAGRYMPSPTLAFDCLPCPAGSFAPRMGLQACSPCPLGEYATAGAAACIKCPDSKTTMGPGHGVSDAACECPTGTVGGAETTSCLSCSALPFLDCAGPFNQTLRSVNTSSGWWRHASQPGRGDVCLSSARACTGGPLGRGCALGHGGVLCMECDAPSGWAPSSVRSARTMPCVLCSSRVKRTTVVVVCAFGVLAAFALGVALTDCGANALWQLKVISRDRVRTLWERATPRSQRTNTASSLTLAVWLTQSPRVSRPARPQHTPAHAHAHAARPPRAIASARFEAVRDDPAAWERNERRHLSEPLLAVTADADAQTPSPAPSTEGHESLSSMRAPSRARIATRTSSGIEVRNASVSALEYRAARRAGRGEAKAQVQARGTLVRSILVVAQTVSVGLEFTKLAMAGSPVDIESRAREEGGFEALLPISLVDVSSVATLGCMWRWLASPFGHLATATLPPLALAILCWVFAHAKLKANNLPGMQRCLWVGTTVLMVTTTNAQARALSMFACRRLSFNGKDYLLSDSAMPCSGSAYASLVIAASLMAVVYCVLIPAAFAWRFREASRAGYIPMWLRPASTGMDPQQSLYEVAALLQRAVVVALFVFFAQNSQRLSDGTSSMVASPLAASASSLMCLVFAFAVINADAFSNAAARRVFLVVQFTCAICMMQLAVMPFRLHWATSSSGVTAVAVGGCGVIAADTMCRHGRAWSRRGEARVG